MHAYPLQLADFVLDHWPAAIPLPLDRRNLSEVLSICFQASLAHEEGRSVRFRLLSANREELSQLDDPWLLQFTEPQPLTPDALRRLSPAAPFQSSLIAVSCSEGTWNMWGIVHTGAGWLAPTWGGRRDRRHEQNVPIIHVLGAGRLGVYAGNLLVASLERGTIEATTTDVFTSNWLSNLFRDARAELKQLAADDPVPAILDEKLIRLVSQQMVRRAIYLIRSAGHGGLLLVAEPDLIDSCRLTGVGPLRLKYTFVANLARGRYRVLLQRLVRALEPRSESVTLDSIELFANETPEVSELQQSIFEVSRLIAGLAAVDGAVLLNKRFEVLGFGAEVSGELPYPDVVWQALDLEGERRAPEAANAVGTRHRAAYRFVSAHPQGLAVVISHDGAVRFVACLAGEVVYWDQYLNW